MSVLAEPQGPASAVVAEADPSVRLQISDLLQREGFDVCSSSHLNETVNLPDDRPVDLAVVNLDIPVNGLPTKMPKGTVFVGTVSKPSAEASERAALLGFSGLVARPLDESQFAPLLHITLARFMHLRHS